MKRFSEMHFDNCPAGGQGRKRNLGDVEAYSFKENVANFSFNPRYFTICAKNNL